MPEPRRRSPARALSKSNRPPAVREFKVVIEQDADGWYVGWVPELASCYSQGRTVDQLMKRMREVVELCLGIGRTAA